MLSSGWLASYVGQSGGGCINSFTFYWFVCRQESHIRLARVLSFLLLCVASVGVSALKQYPIFFLDAVTYWKPIFVIKVTKRGSGSSYKR